jgi:HAD superfamily hydrolase (TIGR01509 family)
MNDLSIHVDLDETLINTSKALLASYHDAITYFGGNFSNETEESIIRGESYGDFLKVCFENIEKPDIESVHAYKIRNYSSYFTNTKVNSDLLDLILSYKASRSVVTNASRESTIDLLEFHNIYTCFDLIVAREDIDRPKPDPQAYLVSMRRIPAFMHVAFEDSSIGIASASSAGCVVFKVE